MQNNPFLPWSSAVHYIYGSGMPVTLLLEGAYLPSSSNISVSPFPISQLLAPAQREGRRERALGLIKFRTT